MYTFVVILWKNLMFLHQILTLNTNSFLSILYETDRIKFPDRI
jgi:hypothetical protein